MAMLFPTLIISTLLVPFVTGRGGGRGGGGGGSGGGGGTTTIEYSTEECYTLNLGAVYMMGNGSDVKPDCTEINGGFCHWIWDDKHHNETRNYLTSLNLNTPTPSWEMEVTDAYYNGSYSLILTPPPSNATYNCPVLKVQDIPNMFLRIGPQNKNNVSREAYGDKNPYYFQFGRSIFERDCPQTPNKAFVNFESSNDNVENAQIWTLQQKKKNGDKFELEGSLTSQFGSYNDFFNYVVNTTGTDAGYPNPCPRKFQLRSLLANTAAKFNATVTASSADLAFSFTDTESEWKVTGSFSGEHWEQGPKLLFAQDTIATEGQTEHVKPRSPKDKRQWIDKHLKHIMIGVGVLALIGILIFLWKCAGVLARCLKRCFAPCNRSRRARRANKKKRNMSDYQTASPSDQPYGTPQMVYANKADVTETVTSVLPHDPRDADCNYAVSPTVMQSYYIRGGRYLVEVANAQMELHGTQRDLLHACQTGEGDKAGFARAMVGHHTAVIEHYMALRAAEM